MSLFNQMASELAWNDCQCMRQQSHATEIRVETVSPPTYTHPNTGGKKVTLLQRKICQGVGVVSLHS